MDNQQEIQVKNLIIKANYALEGHRFDESKQICNEALRLESDNPNIYLIMLLADYNVTEIEDLKNCEVDFDSKNYRNVRRFADKELNDELDKYLSDKNTYKYKKQVDYEKYYSNAKKQIDSLFSKLSNKLKTLDYKELLKDFFGVDYFTTYLYNNKLTKEYLKDNNILLHTKTDSIVQSAATTVALSLAIVVLAFGLFIIVTLTEGKLRDTIVGIGFIIVNILFILRLKSIIALEVIVKVPPKNLPFSDLLMNTFLNFLSVVTAFVAIYYLSYKCLDFSRPMVYGFFFNIIAFFIGLIPQRIIPFYYKHLYSLLKNINYLLSRNI